MSTTGPESSITEGHFRHTPLPQERSIRLLQILRDNLDSISITLEAFPLDQLPEYEALSYTWGKATIEDAQDDTSDPGVSQTITVNSASFVVTENLYDGLYELRNDLQGYLWVDALCIDQTNNQERASQVMLMGDVYSLTHRVIVWLGKEIPEVESVLWLSAHYYKGIDSNIPNDTMFRNLGLSRKDWLHLWESHAKFHCRYRWFHRAWVVQEFVLAPSFTLRCGNKTLTVFLLMRLIIFASAHSLPNDAAMASFGRIGVCRGLIPNGLAGDGLIRSMSNIDLSKTPEQLWYSTHKYLADLLRSQHVSCLHDKVYAFFGIAKISLPSILSHPDLIKVDYNQPADDMFASFTADLMRNLPTLSPLSLSEGLGLGDRRRPGLPSWCPDYGSPKKLSLLVSKREQVQYGVPGFAASLCLTNVSTPPCRVYGRTLCVTGMKIDVIAEPCQHMTGLFNIQVMHDDSTSFGGLLNTCLKMESTHSLTGQDRLEVLWRTLVQDIDHILGEECKCPADSLKIGGYFTAYIAFYASIVVKQLQGEERERYLQVLKMWEESFRTSTVFPSVSNIVEVAEASRWEDGLFIHPLYGDFQAFRIRASPLCVRRRLFITSQKWLGLGPECLESKDELWLLKHAAVPFILRPYGESQYQLVGEAYVHGIMHGELVAGLGGFDGFREIEIV
jgi:Heterokaryon incompatibility protein (HET)